MKVYKYFLLLVFFSCKKENQSAAILMAIQQNGTLVTSEYVVNKIIKANDNQTWYKLGDRKILMSCEARIKAGVSLQNVKAEDVVVDERNIHIQLPAVQLFSINIPPESIRIHHLEVGLLRDEFSTSEREKMLSQAETQIRNLSDSLGILKNAQENASAYIMNLMRQSGFETVTINFKNRP
ncbi:MAG: DUF4230 domain-containing protein [Bacteroidota bacterium]|nr:DUF4230 domain-containing protein [Flavisolibacter sp.]MDQ3552293.1 DUF4230 domain-containing protein [Bacteroidota bacterium]